MADDWINLQPYGSRPSFTVLCQRTISIQIYLGTGIASQPSDPDGEGRSSQYVEFNYCLVMSAIKDAICFFCIAYSDHMRCEDCLSLSFDISLNKNNVFIYRETGCVHFFFLMINPISWLLSTSFHPTGKSCDLWHRMSLQQGTPIYSIIQNGVKVKWVVHYQIVWQVEVLETITVSHKLYGDKERTHVTWGTFLIPVTRVLVQGISFRLVQILLKLEDINGDRYSLLEVHFTAK